MGPAGRRLLAVVGALLLLMPVWSQLGPLPQAAASVRRPDTVVLRTYDLDSDRPADVRARSTGNNLALDFTAGRPLVDGTITVTLPARSWPTPLHPNEALTRYDPGLAGSVVVRPLGGFGPLPPPGETYVPGFCRGPDQPYPTAHVVDTASRRVAVLEHVTCEPGDFVSLRIAGIDAPGRPGRYPLGLSVVDTAGRRDAHHLRLRVGRPVTTRLVVQTPTQFVAGVPTSVTVRAIRPDGRVDRRASGSVRLLPIGGTCPPEPAFAPTFDLAPTDHGVKTVQVTLSPELGDRLAVESISRRATGSVSAAFTVPGEVPPCSVSVSYH